MNLYETEHAWFKEQIAANLVGGLDSDERERFDLHAAECAECASVMTEAAALDREAKELLGDALPKDLEDRIIRRLQFVPAPRRWIHPGVRNAAVAAAAAIVIGGIGFVGSEWVEKGEMPSVAMNTAREKVASNLRQIGQAMYMFPTANSSRAPDSMRMENTTNHDADGQNVMYADGHVEFHANPFMGIQKDHIYTDRTGEAKRSEAELSDDFKKRLSYSYQNPYPNDTAINGGFKLNTSMAPDFAVMADIDREETRSTPPTPGGGAGPGYVGQAQEKAQRFRPAEFAATGFQQPRLTRSDGDRSAKPPAAEQAQAPNVGANVKEDPGPSPIADRKIIRNGNMEFEVESFDASFVLVSKIVGEERGFIASTDSEKLPNGKVKGVIVVRVPPQNLDVLVLKLRGLGDLKNQKLVSEDVTKAYVDLESQLRAARAMEERLLQMIKTGQGAIKELLAAEKELGVWREKIERLQGEINFYNGQVSLSTLSISLFEKDIKTPTQASENENVNMGIETEEVEKARAEAMKAIDEAHGRIVAAELKKFEGGQLAASITADIPPSAAGAVVDRLKQLGKVARLDISRSQTTQGGTGAPTVKVERNDTRLIVSMYNLANVAPRRTINMNLAAEDVETVYKSILAMIEKASGRVVFSNLTRPAPDRVGAAINFEVAEGAADAITAQLRATGQVLAMNSNENPDANNVTTAKRGFSLQLIALSQVPVRESTTATIETADVDSAMSDLGGQVAAMNGRTIDSHSTTQRDGSSVGRLVIELPLDKSAEFVAKAKSAGTVRTLESSRDPRAPEGQLARARVDITLANGDRIVAGDSGLWATVRRGLSTSVAGLLWSLRFIVIGLCFVLPWWLAIWIVAKLWKRGRATKVTATA